MRDSYTLLHATVEAWLGNTQSFEQVMDQMAAQRQLVQDRQDATGLQSTSYQQELEDLAREPPEGRVTSGDLKHLTQRYQMVQRKLQELTLSSQRLTTQEPPPRSFVAQYRGLLKALQILKLEDVRLSEDVHRQTPRLQWLQQEKTRREHSAGVGAMSP